MGTIRKLFLLILLSITVACEEVVDIDLEESAPRLVVEAPLIWDIEQPEIKPLYIRLTTTAPYFANEIPPAEGAEVTLSDNLGNTYIFEEIETGIFKNDGFVPDFDTDYTLEIFYNNEMYEATEQLVSTPPLDYIEQNNNGGFTGDNIELRVFYSDPPNVENHYLFRFHYDNLLSLQISEDELTDGNQTFVAFSEEDLTPGDNVLVEIQGISEGFYNYMYILRSQAGSSGGPFQTQPTLVRGNIVNTTNPDNFPFGYFRLSERDVMIFEIE